MEPWQTRAIAILMEVMDDVRDGTAHAVCVVQMHIDDRDDVAYRYRAAMGPNVTPELMLAQVRVCVEDDISPGEVSEIGMIQ